MDIFHSKRGITLLFLQKVLQKNIVDVTFCETAGYVIVVRMEGVI
jgi:hypothetical protein